MKHDYINLSIWKRAREINKETYLLSNLFPKEERYGLIDQIRRASVSIVSNIAEGSGYESDLQFLKYLFISLGSLCELETQFYVASDLNYIDENQLRKIIVHTDELKRMTLGLIKKLKHDKNINQ